VLELSRERCIPEKKPASIFLETNGFDHIYVAAVKLLPNGGGFGAGFTSDSHKGDAARELGEPR
jgi:hypothetical protein